MAQLTPADLLARLGVPEPQTMAEYDALLDLAIQEILKTDNKSGYRDVYKCGSTSNPWQAKPYIRPKVQRNLGSFSTPEAAAKEKKRMQQCADERLGGKNIDDVEDTAELARMRECADEKKKEERIYTDLENM